MNLITAAAAGVAGCEGGHITVKQRASSTNATVYNDFEGEDAVSSTTTQHTLDANGAVVLYSNEVVDVTAFTSAGAQSRTWTEGSSAPAMEYRGQSFTGTDYESGATGAQYPISLVALLNKWKDSAGSLDFKVRSNAANTTSANLSSIGVGVISTWYFVTDPVYGAKGDGATNDRAAIQAAIDAAELAGGGIVVVGPGTYNIATALVNDADNVHIMGVGSPIIQVTAGNVNAFTLTGDKTKMSGLRIRLATSVGANSTAYAISASGCDQLILTDVKVEYSASGGYKWLRALHITGSSTNCTVDNCYLLADATGTYTVLLDGSSNYLTVAKSTISSAVGGAIHFNGTLDSSLVGCHVSAVGAAITNTGPSRVVLTGNDVYSSGSFAYVATSSARVVTGSNLWFTTTFSVAANAAGVNSVYTDTPLAGADLTAAATISPANPGVHKFYTITAHSANIDNITSTGFPTGFILYLKSSTNSQINDTGGGGNIRTAGASVALTANDMIAFLWDGTNWLQIAGTDN